MKILLIGAGGQLAGDFCRVLARDEVVPVTHQQLDVTDSAAVERLVAQARPECVINTAAFNLVDACEDRSDEAMRVNTLGVYHLARAAHHAGSALVHFSTNYVFDGTKASAYVETDEARPLSVYGFSKLGGEWAARQYCEKHYVVRVAALYGRAGNRSKGGNFIERLLAKAEMGEPLRMVSDQIVNPTSAADAALAVSRLMRTGRYGLYHAVNTQACSWFDFAREILRRAGKAANLAPVSSTAFAAKARRPLNSSMENAAMRAAGLPEMRDWKEALAEYWKGQGG